jgi:hypothetical protein
MNMPHNLELADYSKYFAMLRCYNCVQVQEWRQNTETVHVKEELNRLRTVMQDMRQRLSDDEVQVIKLSVHWHIAF